MGKEKQDASRKGEVHKRGLLRQAIHYILGAAYLVGAQKAQEAARASATVPDEDIVAEGSGSGVER